MQVAQLRGIIPRIRALGGELCLLGNGTVEDARTFRAKEAIEVPLYTDPTLESFKGFHLESGVTTALNPMTIVRAARALGQGHRQTGVKGPPLQQGGAFVIGRAGELAHCFVSKSPGDHPRPAALVDALGRLVADGSQSR